MKNVPVFHFTNTKKKCSYTEQESEKGPLTWPGTCIEWEESAVFVLQFFRVDLSKTGDLLIIFLTLKF